MELKYIAKDHKKINIKKDMLKLMRQKAEARGLTEEDVEKEIEAYRMSKKASNELEKTMKETKGSWREHPVFKEMDDAIEIVKWMRGKEVKNTKKAIKGK